MTDIQKFGRYTGNLRNCCVNNNDHWYFETDYNASAVCRFQLVYLHVNIYFVRLTSS